MFSKKVLHWLRAVKFFKFGSVVLTNDYFCWTILRSLRDNFL